MTSSHDKDSMSSLITDKSMKKYDVMKPEDHFEGELSDGPEPQVEPDNCSKLPQKVTRDEMFDKKLKQKKEFVYPENWYVHERLRIKQEKEEAIRKMKRMNASRSLKRKVRGF